MSNAVHIAAGSVLVAVLVLEGMIALLAALAELLLLIVDNAAAKPLEVLLLLLFQELSR
jgi:hypothetical protein